MSANRKRKKKMPESRARSLDALEKRRREAVSRGDLVRLPTIYISPEEGELLTLLVDRFGSKSAVIRHAIRALADPLNSGNSEVK